MIALLLALVALLGLGRGIDLPTPPAPTPPPAPAPAPGVQVIAPSAIGYEQTLVVTVRGLVPGRRYVVETSVVGEPHTDCILGDSVEAVADAGGAARTRMVRQGWPDVWCTGSDYAGQVRSVDGGPALGYFTVRA